ncbi:hypothetical protein SFRURICE_003421, partial [Spodoptera frugiperda]
MDCGNTGNGPFPYQGNTKSQPPMRLQSSGLAPLFPGRLQRTKKAKAKSSSHDVGLDEAQRQLRASLAQAKRVEVQKDLEEKVAAKERATGAARSRAGYGASNVLCTSRAWNRPSSSSEPAGRRGGTFRHPSHRDVDGGSKKREKEEDGPENHPGCSCSQQGSCRPLNKGVKLAAPRSAAVTVTITPEAAERGETYESVLTRARGFADPIQLGIGPIKCRRTQTGARLFEFPGAAGSQNADLFAAKLREGIADVAKVARPVKSATLEVVDLDDSVSMNEVVAAIAAAGGCSVEAVHGRTIWTGRRGLGMTRGLP